MLETLFEGNYTVREDFRVRDVFQEEFIELGRIFELGICLKGIYRVREDFRVRDVL